MAQKNPPYLSVAGVRNGQRLGGCAVLIIALFGTSCAHQPPPVPPSPSGQPSEVVLPAFVNDGVPFCLEDPSHWISRDGLVCRWTVGEVRRWLANQKALD